MAKRKEKGERIRTREEYPFLLEAHYRTPSLVAMVIRQMLDSATRSGHTVEEELQPGLAQKARKLSQYLAKRTAEDMVDGIISEDFAAEYSEWIGETEEPEKPTYSDVIKRIDPPFGS